MTATWLDNQIQLSRSFGSCSFYALHHYIADMLPPPGFLNVREVNAYKQAAPALRPGQLVYVRRFFQQPLQ